MIVANALNDSRVFKEARSLARHGLRVKVLALSDFQAPDHELVAGFDVERVRVESRKWTKRLNVLRLPFVVAEYYGRTWRRALSAHARIYHSHGLFILPVAWSVARWIGAKVVYDSRDLEIDRTGMSPLGKWFNRKLERFLLPRVERVIVSDGDIRANAMLKAHGLTRDYAVVLNCPTFVDVEARKGKDLKQILNLEASARILLYIGGCCHSRGLEQVVDSLAYLPKEVVFVLMGDRVPSFEALLVDRAKECGVQNRLYFLDPVHFDEIPLYASNGSLGIVLIQNSSLSYYYSTPTKMFECMMAGLPQIASDFPGIRKIMIENSVGPIGALVNPGNPQAIAKFIESLLSNTRALETYRRNALVLAKEIYNWENQEVILWSVYSDLLELPHIGEPRTF